MLTDRVGRERARRTEEDTELALLPTLGAGLPMDPTASLPASTSMCGRGVAPPPPAPPLPPPPAFAPTEAATAAAMLEHSTGHGPAGCGGYLQRAAHAILCLFMVYSVWRAGTPRVPPEVDLCV